VPEEDRGHGDENEPNDFVGWELHATVRASLDDDFSLWAPERDRLSLQFAHRWAEVHLWVTGLPTTNRLFLHLW